MKFAEIKSLRRGRELLYSDLVKKIEEREITEIKDEDVIIRDLNRTFPHSLFFKDQLGDGQRALFRILLSFTYHYKKTGYVQGMAFIVGLFLIYMDEENAFWMIISLMSKYKLEEVYYPEFPGLKKMFYIMLKLMKKIMPDVFNCLLKNKVVPGMYAMEWFITIFTKTLPFEIVVRIFDCFLFEGVKIIYRIALGLLKLKEKEIIACKNMPDIILCLKKITQGVDIDKLFKASFGLSISRKNIKEYEEKFKDINNIKDEDEYKLLEGIFQ